MLIIWGKKMGSIMQKKSSEKMGILRYPQNLKIHSNTFENITILQIIQTCLDCCSMGKQPFFFRKANNLLSLAL